MARSALRIGDRVEDAMSPLGRLAVRIRGALGGLAPPRLDLRAALDGVPHGFCLFDAQHKLLFANEGFRRLYDQPHGAFPAGMPFRDVLATGIAAANYTGRSVEDVWRELKTFIDRSEPGAFLQPLADGRLIAISHQPLKTGGWVAIYEDITERSRAEMHLRFMAHHDALTMLPNRARFAEQLDAALANGSGQSCALLCLDLDGFKPVNDRFGHAAGDEVLRQVADRLRTAVKEVGVAARIGGDEFAVLLPKAGKDDATRVAARLARSLNRPYDVGAATGLRVGVSIGTACAPDQAATAPELMARADAALYTAKRRRVGRPGGEPKPPSGRTGPAGAAAGPDHAARAVPESGLSGSHA